MKSTILKNALVILSSLLIGVTAYSEGWPKSDLGIRRDRCPRRVCDDYW